MNILLKDPSTLRAVDIHPGVGIGFKIVPVIGQDNDWAAYQGLLNWTDERVALDGDKLSQAQAEALFPILPRLDMYYRR